MGRPLVLLFVIVAITWFLIVHDSNTSDDDNSRYVSCWSCGHSIMSEWRLCPYCGAELRARTTVAGESMHRI